MTKAIPAILVSPPGTAAGNTPYWNGTQWVVNSSNIFNNGGNVGIGTTTPGAKLEVAGADARIHGLTIGRGGGSISTNTAIGLSALQANTIGIRNTASGVEALQANITGTSNTANGWQALFANTIGNFNTATGNGALVFNSTGSFNTANGNGALFFNSMGSNNTASGSGALLSNSTGSNNTAGGSSALVSNTTGSSNTGLGYLANVASNNLTNATVIGANAVVDASNKIRLGDAAVTVIEGQVAYTFPSDGRFKTNVSEEVKGLDFITRLRPVVYNFDTRKFDQYLHKNMPDSLKAHLQTQDYSASTAIRQSGFIAQEVEKAMKESGYNFNGLLQPANQDGYYSVAYSQFVMPLVKSVQELNEKLTALEKENAALKQENAGLKANTNNTQTTLEDLQAKLQALEAKMEQLLHSSGTGKN
ncbi:MAG: tail fiber domain-containing protein [Saprospiraceae bacterium]